MSNELGQILSPQTGRLGVAQEIDLPHAEEIDDNLREACPTAKPGVRPI